LEVAKTENPAQISLCPESIFAWILSWKAHVIAIVLYELSGKDLKEMKIACRLFPMIGYLLISPAGLSFLPGESFFSRHRLPGPENWHSSHT
jgi:hypothetical protein